MSSLQGGFTLRRPERLFDIENKAAAFNRAATEPEIVSAFEAVAEEWCIETEKLLAESDNSRQESDDAGPETELEYWRNRMAKFNSITEQLKGRECKVVLGVLGSAKSRVLKRWKLLDNSITDANNEAKDNVKYLSTLEKYIEPLRLGNPETILDSLPGLLNNIKMMVRRVTMRNVKCKRLRCNVSVTLLNNHQDDGAPAVADSDGDAAAAVARAKGDMCVNRTRSATAIGEQEQAAVSSAWTRRLLSPRTHPAFSSRLHRSTRSRGTTTRRSA